LVSYLKQPPAIQESFGGKLLGFIIIERGIEANPDKISAIAKIGQVRNIKGVQQLMRCLSALSRFVFRLGERGLSLYKCLKKFDSFHWMEETHMVLDGLKTLITKPTVLALPEPGENLLLYVVATT
jgi:hypothetical protein